MERGAVASYIFLLAALLIITLNGCSKPDKDMPLQNATTMNSSPDSNFQSVSAGDTSAGLTLFLCGDVMTGRGIDQVLRSSVDPRIYETYVKDARDYVRLAEKKNGQIPKPVDHAYIWGDALQVWEQVRPDARLINLETSITTAPEPWPDKAVQYRMHPNNVAVLTAAGIDAVSLANNHTLDWGRSGLLETMETLRQANIGIAGAGQNLEEAQKPLLLKTPNGRVIILAYGSPNSGVLREWAATPTRSGVNLLPDLSEDTLNQIAAQVKTVKKTGDVVVFSVHWGSNWGYEVPPSHQQFAHWLIDSAGVDLVFGHSSHHPLGMEVYRNKLIVYGAGDFINDYEGISGHERFRDDLSLMYFPQLDTASGQLITMRMVPMQMRQFRLNHASKDDAAWLADVLDRESSAFGSGVVLQEGQLVLVFKSAGAKGGE